MKSFLMALLLAAPGPIAWASSEAITLEIPPDTGSGEIGLARVAPVSPLRAPARVIVSAESALVHMVPPQFPREMQRTGQPGFVRLEVVVDDAGRVLEAAVLESSRDPFAREALRAVEQWLFVAAATPQPNGRRIVRVPIDFRIFRRVR